MINKKGFTLAEIIISMTIIGVIAAITIPALLVSTNEKTMETQKRALHARVSQAMSQIDDLRVYEKSEGDVDNSSAMNFITKGLSKVYRITKTCDKERADFSCDFPSEITTQDGNTLNIKDKSTLVSYIDNSTYGNASVLGGLDTEFAALKTANGESILVYYNPRCRGQRTNGFYSGSAASAMCLNLIYDLNGKDNAPNEVGKDIGFITVFFPKDPDIVSPVSYSADATVSDLSTDKYNAAISACKNQDKALIVPTWGEGMAMVLNKQLINVEDSTYLVSGAGKIEGAYQVNASTLTSSTSSDWSGSYSLRCIYNR